MKKEILPLVALGIESVLLFSAFTSEQRKEIGKRDGWQCHRCGKKFSDGWMLEANHIFPHSDGGPDTTENGEMLCLSCHYLFHEERGDTWADLIKQRLDATGGRTQKWLSSHSNT